MSSGPGSTFTTQLSVFPLNVLTVIVVSPGCTPVTVPSSETVATASSSDRYVNADAAPSSSAALSFCVLPWPSVSSWALSVTLCGGDVTVTVHAAPFPLYVHTANVVLPGPFAVTRPSGDTSTTLSSYP